MKFSQKHCVPCEGGVPKISESEAKSMLAEIPGWEIRERKLFRRFKLKSFLQAITFVNKMAAIAEQENHHPNFCVNYREVDVTLWTHAIDGLSENDFILAAKINEANSES